MKYLVMLNPKSTSQPFTKEQVLEMQIASRQYIHCKSHEETDSGLVAECLGEDIFTQADSWEELRENVKEAVAAYYFDSAPPASVRLHLVRDELLAIK